MRFFRWSRHCGHSYAETTTSNFRKPTLPHGKDVGPPARAPLCRLCIGNGIGIETILQAAGRLRSIAFLLSSGFSVRLRLGRAGLQPSTPSGAASVSRTGGTGLLISSATGFHVRGSRFGGRIVNGDQFCGYTVSVIGALVVRIWFPLGRTCASASPSPPCQDRGEGGD